VDDALAAVDAPAVVELDELLAHRARQPLVEREAGARPVGRHAEPLQLLEDDAAVALLPGPHALQERLAARARGGRCPRSQRALDLDLRRDAGVVGARLEQGLEPLHALEADERVDDRVVEGVAEVQVAGDVRRGDDDGERRLRARGVGGEGLVGPAPHPTGLDLGRLVAGR
jgi:hypothetical protein